MFKIQWFFTTSNSKAVSLEEKNGEKKVLSIIWYDLTRKKIREVKTSEMISKGLYYKVNGGKNKMYKYKIPKLSPVEYSEKELPVDPYVLGALLGDGALTGTMLRLSTNDQFIVDEFIKRIDGD